MCYYTRPERMIDPAPGFTPRAVPCLVANGTVAQCSTTGERWKIWDGRRLPFSDSTYAAYGRPPVQYLDSGDCAVINACPEGSAMPLPKKRERGAVQRRPGRASLGCA